MPLGLPELALASLLSVAAALPAQSPLIIGIASDSTGQQELYRELYYCESDSDGCSVFYLDNNDQLIATKIVDFGVSPQAPSLLFIDYRRDRELAVTGPGEVDDLVIDAGFDNYVRKRWQQLHAGESVSFPFLPANRQQPLAMKIALSEETVCKAEQACFEVSLDSWWLGALVQPIQLTYDRDSQRLLRFRGISNIPDVDGDSQTVDIHYQYPIVADTVADTVANSAADAAAASAEAGTY